MDQRQTLRLVSAAMALLETVMVFDTEFWPAALVMAVVFGLCAWRLGSTGRSTGVLITLVVAFLLELLPLPFYPRSGLGDWLPQGLTAVLSLSGLVLTIGQLRSRRRLVTA